MLSGLKYGLAWVASSSAHCYVCTRRVDYACATWRISVILYLIFTRICYLIRMCFQCRFFTPTDGSLFSDLLMGLYAHFYHFSLREIRCFFRVLFKLLAVRSIYAWSTARTDRHAFDCLFNSYSSHIVFHSLLLMGA